MRLRKHRVRSPRRQAVSASPNSSFRAEPLERRTLLNATLIGGIDALQLAPGTSSSPLDLSAHFSDPTVTGIAAVIQTNQGDIPLNLFNQQEPSTVNNFVQYAVNKSYDNTVIQRAVPGFLLQGGGYDVNQSHITTNAPIQNEYTGISNTVGTIAAALTTDSTTHQVDINSATSDWFINDGNNTTLDAQKFVVFGKVLYNGMQVVDNIEALPKGIVAPTFEPNVNAGDPPDGVLPLENYNQGSPIRTSNYVMTNTITTVNPLTFTVTSDNNAIVTPSVSGNSLTLTAGPTNGVAHITVTATDLGGNIVNTAFDVQVGQTQALLGKGQSKLVRFTDPDGTAAQITYSGPGTAAVSFGGLGLGTTPGKGGVVTIGGTPLAVTVTVTGATAASSLTITGKGGNGLVDIASITSDGPMRAITGRNTSLDGSLTSAGAVASTTLGQVVTGVVTFNSGNASTFNVGTMNNASLFTAGGVKSLAVNDWSHGGTLSATAVGKVAVKGAFAAILNAASVQSFSAGTIGASSWTVSGNLGALTAGSVSGLNATLGSLGNLLVKATLDSSNIRSTGNINSASAATLSNSQIFAGVGSINLPGVATDFTADSAIKTVKVKTFTQSSVAATTLTSVSLGTVQPPTGPSPFGLAAHQIKSLLAVIDGKLLKLKNVNSPTQVSDALTAAGVTSTEPEIRII